nr:hypothetical protein [uncultured Allomuricauda sp.]
MKSILIFLILFSQLCLSQKVDDYFKILEQNGEEPIGFVNKKLNQFDLILFDDAIHSAVEPFDFYAELLESNKNNIDFIFFEIIGINLQPYLDTFFESPIKDKNLLLKVFQNDFTGFGLRYETYYELLSIIWDINQTLPDKDKIKVVGVDQPIYWESIHTREGYDIFQKSLVARDYFMYKMILGYMSKLKKDKKGIFLTNTRHAYKHIKDLEGNLHWNCGTFFNQWHPTKTYSIRIHNAMLSIEANITKQEKVSTEGLEKYNVNWVKMDNGLWDEAFEINDNKPVAISLADNIFGNTQYIGNLMLNVEENQRMYDAYDALIFLKPLDNLYFSSKMDFIYTRTFKKELKRRIRILYRDNMEAFLSENKAMTLEEFVENFSRFQPKTKNNLIID